MSRDAVTLTFGARNLTLRMFFLGAPPRSEDDWGMLMVTDPDGNTNMWTRC